MATAESVKAKLQALLDKANDTTGNTDVDLTAAVDALIEGFGQGGVEYIKGVVAANSVTMFNNVVEHNAGWSRYLYVWWCSSLPPEGTEEYSANCYVGGVRLFDAPHGAQSGTVFGINQSTGVWAFRNGNSSPTPTENSIIITGGPGYTPYKKVDINWVVINLEGVQEW